MSRWKEQREAEKAEELKKQEQAQEPQPPGSLEDVEKEFNDALNTDELLKSFEERRLKESGRMNDIIDTNYYFVVCFNNYWQLQEFCETFNLNPDEIYMDGKDFARRVKRELKEPDLELPKTQHINKDYLVMSLEK